MLLGELAEASGTSAASIKYYRREGLLPPGRRVTATRQEYGQAHLERLQLIQVLREVAKAPIARIRRLTAILDDPDQPLIRALAEAQTITLGVDGQGPDSAPGAAEHPSIAPVLDHLAWPDIDSAPRRALDRLLHSLDSWGAPTHPEMLQRYAEPMAEIARTDVAWMRNLPGQDDAVSDPAPSTGAENLAQPGAQSVSDDVLVMRAVAGAIAYDRLVQLLRALGHTSFSVLSTDPGPASSPGP